MSLKAFHVFFILISILLSIGFGVWAIANFQRQGNVGDLFMGLGSFTGSILLMFYFRWFLRKLKNEGYL